MAELRKETSFLVHEFCVETWTPRYLLRNLRVNGGVATLDMCFSSSCQVKVDRPRVSDKCFLISAILKASKKFS